MANRYNITLEPSLLYSYVSVPETAENSYLYLQSVLFTYVADIIMTVLKCMPILSVANRILSDGALLSDLSHTRVLSTHVFSLL